MLSGLNAKNAMASRLRFRSGDRQFEPEQMIDQGGFADIGPADHGHIARPEFRIDDLEVVHRHLEISIQRMALIQPFDQLITADQLEVVKLAAVAQTALDDAAMRKM